MQFPANIANDVVDASMRLLVRDIMRVHIGGSTGREELLLDGRVIVWFLIWGRRAAVCAEG
jgi:hypothetical protein